MGVDTTMMSESAHLSSAHLSKLQASIHDILAFCAE